MSMMLTFRAGKSVALAVCLAACLSVGACSREQQDWRAAEAADSVESYGEFLQRHPDSELVSAARTRVAQLTEEREWQQAASGDTADAYRQFLAHHPNGKWAQEARIRVQNFALSGLAAQGEPASASVSTPVAVPVAATTTTAPATAPSAVGYGVQLGAFTSETAANAAWEQLKGKFSQLQRLPPHVIAANTTAGTLFRLQAQVVDEAQARALCDMLKKESQACVPVLPH
jgi:cell division septation protein DedD